MAAIVLKSHHESTVGRAALVREATGFPTYGGLVLNSFVSGGLNVGAAEAALALGARVISLPTLSSPAHTRRFGRAELGWTDPARSPAAIPTPVPNVALGTKVARAALERICRAVAREDALLASGHADARTITFVARVAASAGARFLVTHPGYAVPNLSLETQRRLANEYSDVVFERCAYVTSVLAPQPLSAARVAAGIVATGGAVRNVLASDLGQPGSPAYPDGLLSFAIALADAGIPAAEIRTMLCATPRRLLAISDSARGF